MVELNPIQLALLEEHFRLLLRWNARMNLTTVTKLPEAAVRHYCESLFLGAHLTAGSVVDIGSGPGFPGIPVAVLRPDCDVTLVESHQRKAVFLREASRKMSNVVVLAVRGQDVRTRFEWVVSRAVDPEEVLALGLAPKTALLIGEENADGLGFSRIVPLPWGDRRVLAIRE